MCPLCQRASSHPCSAPGNLDEAGRWQAAELARLLAERTQIAGTIYTSQWCRCRHTAEIMAATLNAQGGDYIVVEDWGLNQAPQPRPFDSIEGEKWCVICVKGS